MLNKFKIKSEFSRNVLTLVSGNTIARFIPLLSLPILTRIFSPVELGLFALFMSLLTMSNSFVTAKYDSVILLARNNISVVNVVSLIVLISFFISLFLLLLLILFHETILDIFNAQELKSYIYFLPLMTFIFGLYQSVYFMNLRLKQYKVIRNVTVYRSFVNAFFQIFLGILNFSILGLIVSQLLSTLSGFYYSLKNAIFYSRYIKNIKPKRIKVLMFKYKDFPKYSLPSSVLNKSSYEIVNIMMASFFSLGVLGLFSIGKKAIGAPSKLISTSIKNVFMQKISENRNKNISSHGIFLKVLLKLSLLATTFSFILYLTIEDIFFIVFGEEWKEAGLMAKYLLPYYGISFIASPLSVVLIVYEKQKINFYWQLGLLFLTISILIFEYIYKWEIYSFLLLYTSIMSICYIILIYISYLVSKEK